MTVVENLPGRHWSAPALILKAVFSHKPAALQIGAKRPFTILYSLFSAHDPADSYALRPLCQTIIPADISTAAAKTGIPMLKSGFSPRSRNAAG